jgi:hypothetical protein
MANHSYIGPWNGVNLTANLNNAANIFNTSFNTQAVRKLQVIRNVIITGMTVCVGPQSSGTRTGTATIKIFVNDIDSGLAIACSIAGGTNISEVFTVIFSNLQLVANDLIDLRVSTSADWSPVAKPIIAFVEGLKT